MRDWFNGTDGPAVMGNGCWRARTDDYNQKAVCGTVELGGPTKTAFQRFLKNGPIAFAPYWEWENKDV